MISRENSRLYNILLQIKKDLVEDPETLKKGLDKKLNRSESNYEKSIIKNCEYILSRNSYKALMTIDRYNKRKERNNYEEETKYRSF